MPLHPDNPSLAPYNLNAMMDQASDNQAPEAKKSNVKEDRHFVTALARGLDVLSSFRSGEKLLGNQELAERTKLPKSTVSRLTYTLTKLGYLQYVEEAGKYRLGTASLALGSAMLSRLDIRQFARPYMQELADFSHATVSLGMRDRLSMIYVENCRSQAALTLRLDVGARIPIALTAMGRAYLAETSGTERNEILERVREYDETKWPAIRDGVAYITEDRKAEGFFETMSIRNNILVNKLAKAGIGAFWVRRSEADSLGDYWIKALNVRSVGKGVQVIELSGGNQQKVVIAKSLVQEPDLIIFDEPTRGVDVGAIAEIHQLINRLADSGKAVVVISSYLPEVMGLSDRLLVARQGKIVEEFSGLEATEEKVMYAAVH